MATSNLKKTMDDTAIKVTGRDFDELIEALAKPRGWRPLLDRRNKDHRVLSGFLELVEARVDRIVWKQT